MLSKGSNITAYETDGPLCSETDWLVYPISINVKDKTYKAALELTRKICDEIEDTLKISQNQPCSLGLLDFDTTYKTYKATIALTQLSKDSFEAGLKQYAILKFDSEGAFWEKSEIIASVLDALAELINRYWADMLVDIRLSERK